MSERYPVVDSLDDIAGNTRLTNYARAVECLKILSVLHPEDGARADYRAAAQVFATLALAEATASAVVR